MQHHHAEMSVLRKIEQINRKLIRMTSSVERREQTWVVLDDDTKTFEPNFVKNSRNRQP